MILVIHSALVDSTVSPFALDEESLRLVDSLVTRTDDPVDNTFCEKQLRLLPQVLYSSWNPPTPPESSGRRKFWAAADVGIFRHSKEPPLVPDTFVALDVEPPPNRRGAYFCDHEITEDELQVFVLENGKYRPLEVPFLPRLGLGLTLWQGAFEGALATYLRWCDETGALLLTGDERAAAADARTAEVLADRERLAAKLRATHGIDLNGQ